MPKSRMRKQTKKKLEQKKKFMGHKRKKQAMQKIFKNPLNKDRGLASSKSYIISMNCISQDNTKSAT